MSAGWDNDTALVRQFLERIVARTLAAVGTFVLAFGIVLACVWWG